MTDMKNTFKGWGKMKNYDMDTVIDYILTGKKPSEAKPDNWLFGHVGDKSTKLHILDFGCGVGRNTFGMGVYAPQWAIVGYDNEGMLSKTNDFFKIHYETPITNASFQENWDELRTMKFDAIFCCIVLQHIHEAPLVEYLNDFKQMTHRLVVFGRRFNDDPKRRSTWTVLEENGLIPYKFYYGMNEIPYTPEGAPEDHNLAIYTI